MEPFPSALLTDLYQLTMIQAYLECGQTETAVFEFFVRKLPAQRSFLMAAGLEQALDLLENLRFSNEELGWLERTGKFNATLIDYLAKFRFSGEVHAIREGSVFLGNEPILRITVPLPEAQLVETCLITTSDAPALDCAYKLQEYAGLPRRKRSTGKATWPGRKQIWRRYDRNDRMMADVLSTEQDNQDGEPLIHPVMANVKRIAPQLSLHELRAHARR